MGQYTKEVKIDQRKLISVDQSLDKIDTALIFLREAETNHDLYEHFGFLLNMVAEAKSVLFQVGAMPIWMEPRGYFVPKRVLAKAYNVSMQTIRKRLIKINAYHGGFHSISPKQFDLYLYAYGAPENLEVLDQYIK